MSAARITTIGGNVLYIAQGEAVHLLREEEAIDGLRFTVERDHMIMGIRDGFRLFGVYGQDGKDFSTSVAEDAPQVSRRHAILNGMIIESLTEEEVALERMAKSRGGREVRR